MNDHWKVVSAVSGNLALNLETISQLLSLSSIPARLPDTLPQGLRCPFARGLENRISAFLCLYSISPGDAFSSSDLSIYLF